MTPYRVAGFFIAVALILLPLGSARAGFEDGYAAYERGDYHTAFREFMPLAIAGDSDAQLMIAIMYQDGRENSREEIADILEQSPSLRRTLSGLMTRNYPRAVSQAARDTRPPIETFPAQPPFTLAEVFDEAS